MKTASQIIAYLLIAAHLFLFGWGALGLLEYVTGTAPVGPLQNAAFPAGLQFLHFAALLGTGLVYLAGYASRWRWTPHAMVVAYTVLGTLCAVETIDFLTSPYRYALFVQEIVTYVAISLFLLRSGRMRARFAPRAAVRPSAKVGLTQPT